MEPNLVDYLLYEPEDNGILWIKFNRPERMNALVGTAEENGTVAKVGEYFTVTNWSGAPTVYPGETGQAIGRTFTVGDLRVCRVEYTAGYRADHWCDLGHVLYVLEGELDTKLRDGRKFKLLPGMSYQVSDDGDAPHRSSTQTGAKFFIVD